MAVESIVIKSPDIPEEDPAHIAAMIAKVDGVTPPESTEASPEQTQERPSWLPEKFKSVEDMAKAYKELESKVGAPKTTEAPVTDNQSLNIEQPPAGEAEQALQSKGLDLADFSKEFGETGSLSQESYDKLAQAGYPKDIVDNYIAGQTARSELFVATVKNSVGGNENFTAMSEWAQVNLTPGELNAYNSAIDSGNPDTAKLAVAGLYQRFSSARPAEPELIGGTAGASLDVYESIAQMKADMSNPLYKKDPAFRDKVAKKLGRSNIL